MLTFRKDQLNLIGKVKVKITLEQTTNDQRGLEVQLYSFLNLGARRGRVVNATPRPLYPREKTGIHYRRLGGP
jgi:hypothetical protein